MWGTSGHEAWRREERIRDQDFTARHQVCSVRGLPVGLRSHVTPQGSGWGHQHEHWSLRRRFDPPVKLQGRLGGVLVRCRGLPGNQELHEKIIVAYSPLEDAKPTLLDLFWNTLHERVVAPPRRANVVLLLDANGRLGQDYRCTESHETNERLVSVGPDGSEVTSPNGKRLVLICEQGGLVLANTWNGAAPTCHTPRSPDDHRIDFVEPKDS